MFAVAADRIYGYRYKRSGEMDVIRVFGRAVRRHGDQLFLFDPNTAVTYFEADARTDAVAA